MWYQGKYSLFAGFDCVGRNAHLIHLYVFPLYSRLGDDRWKNGFDIRLLISVPRQVSVTGDVNFTLKLVFSRCHKTAVWINRFGSLQCKDKLTGVVP